MNRWLDTLPDRLALAWHALTGSLAYAVIYDDPSQEQDGGQESYYGFFDTPAEAKELADQLTIGWVGDNRDGYKLREDDYRPHLVLILEELEIRP